MGLNGIGDISDRADEGRCWGVWGKFCSGVSGRVGIRPRLRLVLKRGLMELEG